MERSRRRSGTKWRIGSMRSWKSSGLRRKAEPMRKKKTSKTSISSFLSMYRHRHPLTLPLAFLAMAGSVGVGYIAVQARVNAEPVAALQHVPVVCCDGGEEDNPQYVSEEQVFYRGEGVL